MTIVSRQQPVKVLIVDDSASARMMLRRIIETDPSLQVSGMAQDAYAAARIMKTELPDVILLDLEMPGMDGMTFLRRIMQQHPLPVVICSTLTDEGSVRSVEAMEAGAVDVIRKPTLHDASAKLEATVRICDALQAAAMSRSRLRAGPRHQPLPLLPTQKLTADEILPPPNFARPVPPGPLVVCIGASTGGTEALREVLCALPVDCPPVLVVQHMPKGFTGAFARRLDSLAAVRIREGEDGMTVSTGEVVIAPGDSHMILRHRVSGYYVRIVDGPNVSRHRPSVDVLFRSAATTAGRNGLGILLTGMGDDGATCMGEIRKAGGATIAQNEATSVVFGMPGEAVRKGHAQQILPLTKITAAIMAFARNTLPEGSAT